MAAIQGFGAYLPSRVVTNAELAAHLECEAGWILDVSGIEERRYAASRRICRQHGRGRGGAMSGTRAE